MQLRTEVEIAATPDRVWEVLRDFARYPEWNPFIKSITGELGVGSRVVVVETPPDGSERSYRATLTRVEEKGELRWSARLWFRGLFDGEHFITLRPLDGGTTRVVNAGDFSGLLVKYMGNSLTQTARGLVGMNEALKRRVERSANR
jgi:hypothetical protein